MLLLTARTVLPTPAGWLEGGGVLVEGGCIRRVLAGPRAVKRARTVHGGAFHDLGDVVLAPGLINAHAHLELDGLAGRLPARGGFAAWIRALLAARRTMTGRDFRAGLERGAARLRATGTCTVGDVDSTDAHDRGGALPLRVTRFREVLDARDPARTAPALGRVRRALRARRTRDEGISPHAPYSVSDELLRRVAVLARRRSIPVQVHWAESEEEVEWLAAGTGPFRELLGPSPGRPGLEPLVAAGLLGPTTSLVHGNHPSRGDAPRIAAAGAVVVHCPGTHAFFSRAPFPWATYRRAGVAVALGTDSRASNDDLDLRREMRLARDANPALDPQEVWAMGTTLAARALGRGDRLGSLAPGCEADIAAFAGNFAPDRRSALDALTAGEGQVTGLWVAGRRRLSAPHRSVRR